MYCDFCMFEIEDGAKTCPNCNKSLDYQTPPHYLKAGTILHDKYLVGAAIGEGGFGITYIGRDTVLDMRVAIKEYFPNGYANRNNAAESTVTESISDFNKDIYAKERTKFLSEARTLAKFCGKPGIVEVRDYFEENNTAYIVMEFLEGQNLSSYLKEHGSISQEETLELFIPIMKSLNDIHKMNIIHRDISPDNIMLVNGAAKLTDFGAAREYSPSENKSLSVMLKRGYAPFEQYRSKGKQGAWTDIYALCATMYKCITGITPDESTERTYKDEVKCPSELGIKVDEVFEQTLMKGMTISFEDRYQSIDELLNGFNRINENNHTCSVVDDKTESGSLQKHTKNVGATSQTKFSNDDALTECLFTTQHLADESEEPISASENDDKANTTLAPSSESYEEQRKKRSNKPIIPIISIACAVCLIALGIIFLPKIIVSNETASNNSSSTTGSANSSIKTSSSAPETVVIGGTRYYTNMTGELNLNGKGLMDNDIGDLKYFTNITSLLLDNNYLTNLNAIKDLKNLKILSAVNNIILDISGISNLTNLEQLWIDQNPIANLSSIRNCKKLTALDVSDTVLSDISFISDMKELKWLQLANCELKSIEALRGLTKLETVYIQNNYLTDLTPLSSSHNLKTLNATNNRLNGNLDALKGLKVKESLLIDNNGYIFSEVQAYLNSNN